jgi:hypothetical protein
VLNVESLSAGVIAAGQQTLLGSPDLGKFCAAAKVFNMLTALTVFGDWCSGHGTGHTFPPGICPVYCTVCAVQVREWGAPWSWSVRG